MSLGVQGSKFKVANRATQTANRKLQTIYHQDTKAPSCTKKNVIGYSLLVIKGGLLVAAVWRL
jgi:hypothetical protein